MITLLSNATNVNGGIPLSLVKQAEIVNEKQLLDAQEYKNGRTVTRVRVRVRDQEHTWFAFSHWWASFDDADDETYVFDREDIARWYYTAYANPTAKTPYLTNVQPFVVRLERPGESPTAKYPRSEYVAQHPSGKLGRVLGHGLIHPIWISHKLDAAGLMDELNTLRNQPEYEPISAWERPELVACMAQLGDNGNNLFIIDVEAERQQKKRVRFSSAWCWETGITYFILSQRVPDDVFKALCRDAGLFYHLEELEEEGNWKAWCTTDNVRAAEVLARFGWEATGL